MDDERDEMNWEHAGNELALDLLSQMDRADAVELLIWALTSMGIVVVYWDDTVARRSNPNLQDDTPTP